MVRISVFAHKFRGEDQKKEKKSSAQNQALSWRFLVFVFFLSRNENLLMPGRHKQYFGKVQALKCTSVAPGLLVSFGAQSSLGGIFLAWGE